jgi:hypothetical protein
MNRARSPLALLSAAVLLATGCSGTPGTGDGGLMPQSQSAHSVKHGSAVLRLIVPKHRRKKEHYVSPGTASIKILQNGKSLGTFNTSANSGGCTSAATGISCTFAIAPKVGKNQVFTIDAYALSDATGALLSSGKVTKTVVLDTTTTISVSMGGDIASLSLTLPTPNPPAATPASVPVVVQAMDAAGYVIIGAAPYASPVTVTDADASGNTLLSVNGGAAATTVAVTRPGDSVALAYNGKNLGFAGLSATASGSSAAPLTYFMPQPVLVKTVGTTLPSSGNDALSHHPDATTHSVWVNYQNATTANFELAALAPNGTTRTYTAGQAPSTNLPSCPFSDIDATGPSGQVWFTSECNPGVWGFVNPSTGATTAFTAPNHFANFGEIAGAQVGDAAIYSSIYDYNASQWSTVRADSSGNIGPELSNGNSDAYPLVGSKIYNAFGSQLDLVTITGSGPTATLADGGLATFLRDTSEFPTAAPDNSLWDAVGCTITHVVPGSPFSSSAASYYFAPAALCQSVGLSFEPGPIVASDGTVWTTASTNNCDRVRSHGKTPRACGARSANAAGGFNIFGTLASASPDSAPFSTGAIPTVTVNGTTIPFEPDYAYQAADGNLGFIGTWNTAPGSTIFYFVEIAY